ncbi:MAG: aminoacyl-tRNA hydrolase [Candidatus Omnitrophota bacterium]
MKLIVGLGNPGMLYAFSRHNIGFSIAKALAKARKSSFKKELGIPALSAGLKFAGNSVLIAAPLTFMNLSGAAVSALLKKYAIEPGNLLVVCDDLDLEFGCMRIRPQGSSGGHRGLQSIIGQLQSKDFCRLRVGIGRPAESKAAAEYVLSAFIAREKKELKQIIAKALDCCETWIKKGTSEAMNEFNQKEKKPHA